MPLIVLDYPGEEADRDAAYRYVTAQHRDFIGKMEELSGNKLDEVLLNQILCASAKSVEAWGDVMDRFPLHAMKPAVVFDDMSFLVTIRCKKETAELYRMMAGVIDQFPPAETEKIPLFWLGYPLWYHPERCLLELLDGFRIVGPNYATWWNLDYSGEDIYEKLFQAYNYTFLNLSQETRDRRLGKLIQESGAACAVTVHNKSCKCDFVSAKNITIPQAELEADMIDRNFMDMESARRQVGLLREALCTG